MAIISDCLVGFVAFSHLAFLILEMFLWNRPIGHKIFKMNLEQANLTAKLAINQGLYNGFLAVGLFWSLYISSFSNIIFFLSCVIVAGIVGAITVKRSIFFIQSLPAILALASVVWIN